MPVLMIFYRTVLIYFVLLLVMRLMGKREIGQLSAFDFVVAIVIAEVAALPMLQPEIPLLRGLLPLVILVVLEIAFSYVALYNRRFRCLMCGEPQLVIRDGRILHREMRRARYNLDDLLSQLREKGYPDPAEIMCAVLENSGRLSVVPRGENKPVTRGDLGLEGGTAGLPCILVADGEVLERDLAVAGLDRAWLESELKRRGLNLPQVFLASLSPDGRLFVSSREGFDRGAAKKTK
jgi:uncharacterized membrane protein YcaP (DUF421 family)